MFAYYRLGSEDPARSLLLAAGLWSDRLHNEIWVFNQGYWQKDPALWTEVQKADWKDVILKEEFKEAFKKDVYGFFSSEPIYKDLAIPWKVRDQFLLGQSTQMFAAWNHHAWTSW